MNIEEVMQLIPAEVLTSSPALSTIEIAGVCGADLMSDVLVFCHERMLLLTGLTSPQVVRSAEVAGLAGIVFVRGKRPGPEVIRLAESLSIPLLATELPMYETCGVLYEAGLPGTGKRPAAIGAELGREP